MNGPLSILLVDDNPDDRALVIRELSREFPDRHFCPVTDHNELSQALERGPWDLVVTDYQLNWSDGLTILMAVKNRWPGCPVIMFTGSGNEEIAVQAMKAGLDDYVLKSPRHYARLSAAAILALDRARQRRALREAETRYQDLFNRIPVGLFCVAPDGRMIDANPAMVKMLGYRDRQALLGLDPKSLFASVAERGRWLAAVQRSGVVEQFELRLRRCDGKIIWVEINARAVKDERGRTRHREGSAEDITARKRAEERLRDSREQLRALAAYLQSVREEERTRLAREMHDEVDQALAALQADLSSVESKLTEGTSPSSLSSALERLKTLPDAVNAIMAAIRRMVTELRPPVLDDLGLEAAIEWQIRQFEERTGIKCEWDSKVRNLKLDPEQATALFRIFQETLTNIVRQAKATKVSVHLKEEGGELVLEIQNDGRTITRRETSGRQSLDLLGMRERATLLEGEVSIVSGEGKGTLVGVRVPLHRAAELKEN